MSCSRSPPWAPADLVHIAAPEECAHTKIRPFRVTAKSYRPLSKTQKLLLSVLWLFGTPT